MLFKDFYLFRFCAVLSSALVIVNAQWAVEDDSFCQTPDDITGTCVIIRECAPMMDFLAALTTGISKETTQLLRRYQCGFEGRNPKVCCPPTNELFTVKPPDVSAHKNIGLLPKNCGYVDTGDKIINGQKTGLFEFPWMVLLSYKTARGAAFLCGATIINERYILTAAHCVTALKYPLLGLRIGEHDTRTQKDCEQLPDSDELSCAPPHEDLTIEEITVHPQYNLTGFSNDIGLIRVNRDMNFSLDHIKPICMPLGSTREYNFTSRNVVVTGWGVTERGQSSPELLKVTIPFIPLDECRRDYQSIRNVKITQKQLCAGGRNQMDSCGGDSGGPLQVVAHLNDDSRYIQQGIVSFGPKICGSDNNPGVYTRVAYYMDWILDTIKP